MLGGLGTGNQGGAEAHGEAALAGGAVFGGLAGVVRLDDVDFLAWMSMSPLGDRTSLPICW
ncbi:hypothetical protein BC375_03750 [Xylella fastidiosa]|nr:hypothetical protein BC375_03750 [Xylella fastidiosa]